MEELVYIFSKEKVEDYFEENEKLGYAYRDETEPYFIYTMYPIQTILQRRQR